jgi:hypothetical protein
MSTSDKDEWLSPSRRQRQPPGVVTPNVSSIASYPIVSNPFGSLLDSDTETEVEDQENTLEVPEENPEVVTEGGPNSDKDSVLSIAESTDTFDIETEEEMSSPMVAIETLLDPQDLRPFNGAYNISDARLFRTRLGNVLSSCVHQNYDGGHAYLVDTVQQYKLRLGDRTLTTIPTLTPRQVLPLANASSGAWKRYDALNKQFVAQEYWNAEALKAIEKKFPAAILEKKTVFDALPMNFTARQGLDYIDSKVNDVVNRQEAYNELQATVAAMKYVTNPAGPIKFFSAMALIKRRFDILDVVPHPWESIIVNCQTAIRQCGMDKSKSRDIDTAWEIESSSIASADIWTRFTEFYIIKLEFISRDGVGDGHNAALRAELSDLKTNIGKDMETLHNNQQQLGTAYTALTRPSSDSVPSFINTDASTVVTQSQQATMLKEMSDLRKEMALLVNSKGNKVGSGTGTGTSGGGRGGGTSPAPRIRPTTWRQWDKWCWTHGSHLTHDSMTCDKKYRKSGHDETATKENPMNGNTSRDHLYMQWCSPVDNSAHANKGE